LPAGQKAILPNQENSWRLGEFQTKIDKYQGLGGYKKNII
jgi:hypothetical protein